MFKVTERPQFRWPISFQWAGDGHYENHTFTAVFRRLPAMELADMAQTVQQAGFGFRERVEFVDRVLVRFEDVEHDGTEQELREWMFQDAAIVNALFTTYSAAIQGIEVKNSETPPAVLSG